MHVGGSSDWMEGGGGGCFWKKFRSVGKGKPLAIGSMLSDFRYSS